jgi:hypothetical protein
MLRKTELRLIFISNNINIKIIFIYLYIDNKWRKTLALTTCLFCDIFTFF